MAEAPSGGEKETKKAWEEVGQHFSSVGKRVGEHYRKLEGEARTADSERQSVNDAIKRVVDEMDRAFTGLGNALRDPQTKESLNSAAKSLSEALDATFSGIGQKVRQRTGGRKESGTSTRDQASQNTDA